MTSPAQRLALVTGAGSGIGRAAAGRLSGSGTRLILVGRREDPLRETAGACEAAGSTVRVEPVDLTGAGGPGALAAVVAAEGGRLDVLVQSAGEALHAPAGETRDEDWERVLGVNLTAPFRLIRELLPALREAPRACVVNVASTLGLGGLPGAAAYCAAKGGLVQLTRALALELAPEGIRVNAVCPGLVDTPMLAGRGEALAAVEPVGRLGRPEEIAAVIGWLCSEESGFTTGVAWPVDGGLTAGWPQ